MPGVIGERSRKYLEMEDPLDMALELATARAVLSFACERYGQEKEALDAAMETGTPARIPDAKEVIQALAVIERIVNRMHTIKMMDSIPVDRITEIYLAMRDAVFAVVTDEQSRKAVLDAWQQLELE